MPGATPAMEVASSAFMSFWMNNIGVEIALLQPLIKRFYGEEADANQLLLTLLFLHLSLFFSPMYERASGGAIHNPTVYFLFYLLGQVTLAAALVGFLCTVLGTILGTFAYIETLRVFPMPGFTGVAPVVAAGGPVHGAAAEAAVAFVNFVFAGLVQPAFGVMGPYAGAFFYVLTVVVEKCRYSCGFMNPAVVLATHAAAGDLTSKESLTHVGAYFVGALGGAAATAALSKLATGKGGGAGAGAGGGKKKTDDAKKRRAKKDL